MPYNFTKSKYKLFKTIFNINLSDRFSMRSSTLLTHCFPSYMSDDVNKAIEFLLKKKTHFQYFDQKTIKLSNQCIGLLHRIYHDISMHYDFSNFSLMQRQILWCIFTRHHDGFVRQLVIEKLLNYPLEYFMMPFIFQLLGEYVQEILKVITPFINKENQDLFIQFILENPQYFQTTEKRIVSYWNEYYRDRYTKFEDYIGAEILHKLKKALTSHPI